MVDLTDNERWLPSVITGGHAGRMVKNNLTPALIISRRRCISGVCGPISDFIESLLLFIFNHIEQRHPRIYTYILMLLHMLIEGIFMV